jgi:hypothetical protein
MPSFVEIPDCWRSRLFGALLALAGLGMALVTLPWLTAREPFSLQDFVEYWGAGRLNAHGDNPYDPDLLFQQEREVSPELTNAIMMWNPPWTLAIAMPFGLLPARIGLVLWLGLQLSLILVSADFLWRYYGGETPQRWMAWLVSLSFVPTFMVLRFGQISPLVLLGMTGFLVCERNKLWGWAGACVVLAAVKPHVVILFGFAVLLWAWDRRRPWIIFGGAVALVLLTAIPLACNAHVLDQYREALGRRPPEMLSPTIGSLLRLAFGLDQLWLQYVPLSLGLVWLWVHWRRRRETWQWAEQTPVLLMASFLTASYGAWQFDLVVLLIPVIQASVWISQQRHPGTIGFALTALFGFDALALALMNIRWSEQYWHVWMTPMILCSYLALRKQAALVGC